MKPIRVVALVLAFASLTSAQEFKPEVKVGATIFTGWEYNIDNAEFISKLDTTMPDGNAPFGLRPVKYQFETNRNTFFLDRAYLNVRMSLTPELFARVTPDVFSFTDGNGRLQFAWQIKFAYLSYTPVKTEKGLSLGFTAGVIPNLWTTAMDKYFGYRGMIRTFTDYPWTVSAVRSEASVIRTTNNYFSTADLGADIALTLPNGYAEINADILNGNNFRNLGFDTRFKDLMFAAFIHPLAGQINKKTEKMKKAGKERIDGIADLTFGGFAYIGKLDKGENYTPGGVQYKRNRFGGMAHVRFNFKRVGFVRLGGEYSVQANDDPAPGNPDSLIETNARGISSWLEFAPPVEALKEKLSLIAKLDIFDPNISSNEPDPSLFRITFNNLTDRQALLLVGLAFKPAKIVTIGVNYQSVMYQEDYVVKYDGTTTDSDGRFFFNVILDF